MIMGRRGYAFNDVDLNYEDEEAKDAVLGVFKDMLKFCEESGVSVNDELKSRGVLVEEEKTDE